MLGDTDDARSANCPKEKSRGVSQDKVIGAFCLMLALAGWWIAQDLPFKSSLGAGSGYMPRILCAAVALVSVVIIARAVAGAGGTVGRVSVRPLLFVIAALAVFAILIELTGLAVAGFASVVTASFAAGQLRVKEVIVLAAGLSVISTILFCAMLGMPMRPWPW